MGIDWHKRTCLQKLALIVSFFTCCVGLVCLIGNIFVAVRAKQETWFTNCNDCKYKGGSGTEDCDKCCAYCTWKDPFFFYVMRTYSMLFCLLVILAEFPIIKPLRSMMKVLKYYWGRGILQLFVGFLTLIGGIAPDDPDAAAFIDAVGWIMIGLAALTFLMTLLCIKDYSDLTPEEREAQGRANYGLPPAQAQPPPQTQPPPTVTSTQPPPPQQSAPAKYQELDGPSKGVPNGNAI